MLYAHVDNFGRLVMGDVKASHEIKQKIECPIIIILCNQFYFVTYVQTLANRINTKISLTHMLQVQNSVLTSSERTLHWSRICKSLINYIIDLNGCLIKVYISVAYSKYLRTMPEAFVLEILNVSDYIALGCCFLYIFFPFSPTSVVM